MCLRAKLGLSSLWLSGMISGLVVLAIMVTLLWQAWPSLSIDSTRLLTSVWDPHRQQFGILSMLYGTVIVSVIALALALPVGVLTAVYLSEWLPSQYRFFIKSALEWLAGVPSIIYGLIGIALLVPLLAELGQLDSGRTLLAGGLLLAIMVLPTIITLVDDALHHVPQHYRDTAMALGFHPHEVILRVILPLAKVDVIGAALLALGRALGETMAVMLVIGGIDRVPKPWFDVLQPGQTMTSKLGRELSEAAFGSHHFSALVTMGFVLFLMVLVLTWLANAWFKPESQRYE